MPRFRQHADAVAARTGFSAVDAGTILKGHLDQITETLAADERVVLTGFGTFRMSDGKPVFVPSDALISALTRDDSK